MSTQQDEIISFPVVAKPEDMPSTIWKNEYPDIVLMSDDEVVAELSEFRYHIEQAI